VLLAVLVLAALAAGAFALGRATREEDGPTARSGVPTAPRPLDPAQSQPIPALSPVGALPDLRGG
jgi:hypothetical protein